ncbi:hypothetical protein [Kerstersia similis]|uniref:hypothetical protein n=1 Tax=Kerstersia similis TaxID=206505 RepID=UPI0039EF11AE
MPDILFDSILIDKNISDGFGSSAMPAVADRLTTTPAHPIFKATLRRTRGEACIAMPQMKQMKIVFDCIF